MVQKDVYKYQLVQGIFIACGLVLIAQTATLQLFNPNYRQKAEKTTMKKEVQYPSRGLIFDRSGRVLVVNTPRYELQLQYNRLDPEMDTAKLCSLLHITKEDFYKKSNKNWKSILYSKAVPFSFIKNIPANDYANIQEHLHEFPGFSIVQRNVREYPHKSASHLLGYLNEVDEKTLEDSVGKYVLGDYIGTSGLEKYYERDLRGKKGTSFKMVDVLGRPVESFNEGELDVPAQSGKDIVISIDLELQEYAEKLMSNLVGSVVAIEPSTGEILTMTSAPNYDPNLMTVDRISRSGLNDLLVDSLKPFFDRSLMAKYPPASIFKPIMALIGLQEGVIHPYTSIFCPGYYQYEGFKYGCHFHPYTSNIKIAIQHSCNAYFFQTFRNMIEQYGYKNHDKGLDVLVDYLYEFGLGRKLGIDLPSESPGFIPTASFYDQLYPKYRWKSTYIMSIGIGQGEMQLTTLQMANLASIIANRGFYKRPHLIKEFMDTETRVRQEYQEVNRVSIDTTHFGPIVEGMERAVQSGTAYRAYLPSVKICGKTGTSQNVQGEDHSVFFAFAPKDNPKIAIAVYIENAGTGGDVAAPLASLLIEKYLNGETTRAALEARLLAVDLRNRH